MIKNQKGATSVIVILIMLVLLVFGLAAFSASYSNYTLGQRSVRWSAEFYALEDKAEETLHVIDKILVESRAEASLPTEYLDIAYGKLLNEQFTISRDEDKNLVMDLVFFDWMGNDPKHLQVRLLIHEQDTEGKRYTITEWFIWQEPFSY
ncbi:MAG: hypothetical protein R6W96_07620 [Clostridia bacterium]